MSIKDRLEDYYYYILAHTNIPDFTFKLTLKNEKSLREEVAGTYSIRHGIIIYRTEHRVIFRKILTFYFITHETVHMFIALIFGIGSALHKSYDEIENRIFRWIGWR